GAVFDDVTLELGTTPGQQHVVRINGQDYGGFQQSDQKFLRLLVLAAARARDPNVDGGGWVPKWALHGDEHDDELADLRAEPRKRGAPLPEAVPALPEPPAKPVEAAKKSPKKRRKKPTEGGKRRAPPPSTPPFP